ncbi:MATE family efflux transporter [uncultured Rothia sp.]|uniref:MATE family efflux transporter n=1 Tax=uncultured Rothia sp. TaxID=316088 RepID=UPI003216DB3A
MSKALVVLGVPMALGTAITAIYSIINSYFIGHFGTVDMLAAINYASPTLTIMMEVGGVFGVGAGTLISRLLGEKQFGKVAKASSFGLWGSVMVSAILGVLGMIFASPLASFLGATGEAHHETVLFLITAFATTPLIATMFTTEQLVRSEGYAKELMYGLIIGTVVNLILDVILFVFLGTGITGAAIAMAFANGASTLYYLWILNRKSATISWRPSDFTLSSEVTKPVFAIGSSELVQSSFMVVSGFLLNLVAASYGNEVVAVVGVAQRIVMLPEMISMGITLGGMALFAYAVDARNQERITGSIRTAALMICGVSVVFGVLVFIFRDQALLLIGGEALLNQGDQIVTAMLISVLFNGLTMLAMVWFQAAGKAVPAMIMACVQGALFIPVLLLMNMWWAFTGLVWALTVTEFLTFALGVVLFMVTGGTAVARLPK